MGQARKRVPGFLGFYIGKLPMNTVYIFHGHKDKKRAKKNGKMQLGDP